MAGRDSDRSRPAKRTWDEDHDTSDNNDEEEEPQQTKRKRCEDNLSFSPKYVPSPYSLVVGGCPAAKGQFPYLVALRFDRTNGDIARGGGIIIGYQWILTAAHLCIGASKAIVLAGAYPTQNEPEQSAEADLIVIQDAYRRNNKSTRFIVHDVALLRLKKPLNCSEMVQTIALPSKSEVKKDFAGEIAVLSGWGKMGEFDDKPIGRKATLNFAYEKILSNVEAAKMLQVDEVPPTILAAIGTDGRACSCNGDSGGPLVLKGQNGKTIVVGIVSHRIGNCGGPQPHLLTRITAYIPWIQKIITSSLKGETKNGEKKTEMC